MKRINFPLFCFLLSALFSSCNRPVIKEPSTFTVRKCDFEEVLNINGVIETAQISNITCPNEVYGTISYLIDNGTDVKPGDTLCIIEDADLNKRYNDAVKALETAKGLIESAKIDLEIKYALVVAEAKSNDGEQEMARLDSLQLEYATPSSRKIKELELKRKVLERKQLDKKLKNLEIINRAELRTHEMNLMRYTMEEANLKRKKGELYVKAIQPGKAFIATNYSGRRLKVGDRVWRGRKLYFIPDLSKLKVKLLLSESLYKRIELDNPVEYSFDAMPGNKAWGKISLKASAGQPVKEGSSIKIFEMEASVDSFKTLPAPDLTVNCRVLLKQIKDTLVIPQVAIFEQDSMKVVYVRRKGGYEMRQIITGTTSSKEAVVIAGLVPKEKIALSKPDLSLIIRKKFLSKDLVKKHKNQHSTDTLQKIN